MNKPTDLKSLLFGDLWDYAPARQTTSMVKLKAGYGHFINGECVEPEGSTYFKTINPATEKPLAEVASADAATVDKAVKAARNAYENVWRDMPGAERAKY